MEAHNDNDELSFITLGMAVRNVTRYLERSEDHERDSQERAEKERTEKEKRETERAYIEQRLRDIERFEARYLRKRT